MAKEEVRLALCHNLLHKNGGVLWVTVSLRGLKAPTTHLQTQVIPDILHIGYEFGYTLVLQHSETYNSNRMGYVLFISTNE